MEYSNKLTRALEKLFWLFLYLNPLLDILNGLFISNVMTVGILDVEFVSTLGVTPSLVIRMLFLVVFVAYIFLVKDKYSILAAIPLGLAWVLSVVSELKFMGEVRFFIDAQYMARFCYNIALLMVYSRVFARRWGLDGKDLRSQLNTVVNYTVVLLSLAILIPAVLGVGYSTYADRLGYRGNRGFFYAGNDVTAVLMLLLPITIVNALESLQTTEEMSGKRRLLPLPALASALGANTMLIIGSKTAFLATLLVFSFMLVYVLIDAAKNRRFGMLKIFVLILILVFLILGLLNTLSFFQTRSEMVQEGTVGPFRLMDLLRYRGIFQTIEDSANATEILAENEGMANALLNGRQVKFSQHLAQMRNGGVLVWLFGMGRGSQENILEMDLFEVLFYYGLFGAAAMLWLYVRMAIRFFRGLFRAFNVRAFALFLALGMTFGYLTIAGHVLFSVTSGFYLVFVIIYSQVCFAKSPEEILLWKQ